jgi:hypothetical protein
MRKDIQTMTYREAMLATIVGQPTEQIPWAPRLDLWTIAHRARGTLPARFQGLNMADLARALDVACHAVGADFTLVNGRDISLRALGIDNHQDYPYRIELHGLPVESSDDGEDLRTLIHAPAGDIFTHLYRSLGMAREGISLPFFKSYAIESPADFEAVAQIFEHLVVIPTPDAYRAFQQRVGDQGLAVARGLLAASPMHLLLHELVPMDQFFYLYADERQAMHQLAERMEPFFEAVLDAVATCDAEVVFWGANYDQDLTWPPFFAAEILPWLRKVSARLHAAGKFLLTHTDGENRDLLPLYRECGIDVAESICPKPMTKCTLAETRAGLTPTTVFGGIPSVALLDDAMTDTAFATYLDELFGSLGAGDHLILGVADNVPPDANWERLVEIKRRIEQFGAVVPPHSIRTTPDLSEGEIEGVR